MVQQLKNQSVGLQKSGGSFRLSIMGVPIEVLENVKEATHRFFRLPAEEKRKYLKEFSPSNNVRFGTSFSPEVEKALEWKDYLSLFYVSEDEASALWPSVCRDQVLDYMRRSEIVIRKATGCANAESESD
ncbi:hypothetical protein OIU77_022224 [Salix suchowensis]|uniref:Non-haem dioxygenase N-terminal domain-containing protein n=1 Tax=Salix suchowensis TaxID=1278906 RepID=A0ABQ9BZI5_9ROSI|nr:hypothetical protein OIU77_022224 [Salix suchowensis]